MAGTVISRVEYAANAQNEIPIVILGAQYRYILSSLRDLIF